MGTWTPGPGATAGDDIFIGDATAENANGGGGADEINGRDGNDTLNGGAGLDELYGNANDDVLVVVAAELVSGETLNGGSGVDTLSVFGDASVLADASITSIERLAFALGGSTSDFGFAYFQASQFGAGLSNTLAVVGGPGSNLDLLVVTGISGAFDASGWTFTGWQSFDSVRLYGTNTANTITGTSQSDWLDGGDGSDTLFGGAGNDEFFAGPGGSADGDVDEMRGGLGNDVYGVFDSGDLVIEAFGEGTDRVNAWIDYTLPSNVENMDLWGATIIGYGNSLANSIIGNGNANLIIGYSGDDFLYGEEGDDTVNGGLGVDELYGGLGNDTLVVESAGDKVIENAGEGTDTVQSSISWSLASHFENLTLTGSAAINATGNGVANILTGNNKNNSLNGLAGADTMIGGGGNDTYFVDNFADIVTELASQGTDTVRTNLIIYTLAANVENVVMTGSSQASANGNSSNNRMTGNTALNSFFGDAGNDTLDGGAGNDELWGGVGNDQLIGGAGADTFRFFDALGAANRDTILDFSVAEDIIALSDEIFTALPVGLLAASAFHSGAGGAHDADDRIIYNPATGALFYDPDGTGAAAANHFATLDAGLALTHADIVVLNIVS